MCGKGKLENWFWQWCSVVDRRRNRNEIMRG